MIPIRVTLHKNDKLATTKKNELCSINSGRHQPGLFGLDLNLLLSLNSSLNRELNNDRTFLLNTIQVLNTLPENKRYELREQVISRLKKLWEIIPSAFITIPEKYILMEMQFTSNKDNDTNYLSLYKQVIPLMKL